MSSALILAFGVSAAKAQTGSYRADVPFDFTVKNDRYEAGRYSILSPNPSASRGAIMLVSRETGKAKIIGLDNAGSHHNTGAKLIFSNIDGRYFLTDVVAPNMGLRLKRTKTRVQIVKKDSMPVIVALH